MVSFAAELGALANEASVHSMKLFMVSVKAGMSQNTVFVEFYETERQPEKLLSDESAQVQAERTERAVARIAAAEKTQTETGVLDPEIAGALLRFEAERARVFPFMLERHKGMKAMSKLLEQTALSICRSDCDVLPSRIAARHRQRLLLHGDCDAATCGLPYKKAPGHYVATCPVAHAAKLARLHKVKVSVCCKPGTEELPLAPNAVQAAVLARLEALALEEAQPAE